MSENSILVSISLKKNIIFVEIMHVKLIFVTAKVQKTKNIIGILNILFVNDAIKELYDIKQLKLYLL